MLDYSKMFKLVFSSKSLKLFVVPLWITSTWVQPFKMSLLANFCVIFYDLFTLQLVLSLIIMWIYDLMLQKQFFAFSSSFSSTRSSTHKVNFGKSNEPKAEKKEVNCNLKYSPMNNLSPSFFSLSLSDFQL